MSGYVWYLLIMLVISTIVVRGIVQISSEDRIRIRWRRNRSWPRNRSRRKNLPPPAILTPYAWDWLAVPANARKLVIISWVAAAILGLGWWGYTHPDTPLGRAVWSFLTALCIVWVVVGGIMGYLGLFGEVIGWISDLAAWARKHRFRKR